MAKELPEKVCDLHEKILRLQIGETISLTSEEQDLLNRYPVTKNDPVNHPKHYTSHPSGVECITITRHMTFNCGNAVKYLWRNGLKGSAPKIQDLEKAIWYIKDEIEMLKNKGEEK